MRWTRFAITVLVIAACAKGERDQSSQSASTTTGDSAMSTATTPADTMMADSSAAAMTADTVAPKKAATGTATKPAKADTTAAARATAAAKPGATPVTGPSGAEAMMGLRANVPPQSLSKDQIKRLQAALKKNDCYSGTPDGVTGPGTQSAVECGLKKYNLTPNDMSGLYRKLGLKF